MRNKLYGLTNQETTKLNQILEILTIDQLANLAIAVKVLCLSGFGSLKIVVKKGELRMDLSSTETPILDVLSTDQK